MDHLLFHFDCLDGSYGFQADFDPDGLRFEVESTIPDLDSLSGTLEDTEVFRKELELAQIEK